MDKIGDLGDDNDITLNLNTQTVDNREQVQSNATAVLADSQN